MAAIAARVGVHEGGRWPIVPGLLPDAGPGGRRVCGHDAALGGRGALQEFVGEWVDGRAQSTSAQRHCCCSLCLSHEATGFGWTALRRCLLAQWIFKPDLETAALVRRWLLEWCPFWPKLQTL